MFLGIDHGTTAIRFADSGGRSFEISRSDAAAMPSLEIVRAVEDRLGIPEMAALSYSMGDGLTKVVSIDLAPNRGLLQMDGAGSHVGGGTRVYDAVLQSGWPALLLPGIHRGSDIDPRMKVFSHGMSPEKVGLAYGVYRSGAGSFIVSDASSNTVTFAVLDGRIVGAIDAPIFAPGLSHGPLDVEAIRRVDAGLMTANQAFTCGGILPKMGISSLAECDSATEARALETLAMFTAMEIEALGVLVRDLGEPRPAIFLAGDPAPSICRRVSALLGRDVSSLDRYAAALGCAKVAEDVFCGARSILGIVVDESVGETLKLLPSISGHGF